MRVSIAPRRRRRAQSLSLAALALAFAPFAAHAIYKCAGTNSTPMYQEEPCPPGKELRNFDTDPPNLSIVPGGPSATAPRESAPPSRAAKVAKAEKRDKPEKLRGDPAQRKHVRVGMTEAELLAHLGQPDVTSGNKQKRSLRWVWLPVEGDPDTITTVTLANGAVTDVDRKVVKK
jgi:hypothetical protein